MYRKIILILFLSLFTISCSDTLGSVKRGLTGAKGDSADEFLVKKKDPLILPPDFENLPTPDERMIAQEEISLFEKKLEITMEDNSSTSTSTEESILKKIQSK
tara:strand:- start:82 stop:390 length:309 start_codon:yes stop_codon:yes gene_type:complete